MFRKMRRFKQELSREECIEILKSEPRGVLSVMGEDGYPYGIPMKITGTMKKTEKLISTEQKQVIKSMRSSSMTKFHSVLWIRATGKKENGR